MLEARRSILVQSDQLMELVEELSLRDQPDIPRQLRIAIDAFAQTVPCVPRTTAPSATHAAHRYLLSLQTQVMRVQASPSTWKRRTLPDGQTSQELSLPEDADLIPALIERAADRWDRRRGIAVTLARRGDQKAAAKVWRLAEAAWANYIRLLEAGASRP